jgi:hypothetical protein
MGLIAVLRRGKKIYKKMGILFLYFLRADLMYDSLSSLLSIFGVSAAILLAPLP